MAYLIVFLGAGLGGAARHGVNVLAGRLLGLPFPFGTLAVNIAGSFLMGVIAEYFALKSGLPMQWRLFLTTGILGGFTTFSAFSLEAGLLFERGEQLLALAYILGSVMLSIGALFAALVLVRAVVSVP
ncbi:MAG: fluoride efflux transporter CrcB [Ferrovibrio sp.]